MTDNEIIKALERAIEYGCGHYIEMDAPTIKNALDLIKHQKAEIEDKSNRLREILPMVADIKDKAIKDFAIQVKMELCYEFDGLLPSSIADRIDNLVKEMIGEANESI